MQKIYTVRPGDTLGTIAAAADIKLEELLKLNPQIHNPNLIRAAEGRPDREALVNLPLSAPLADRDPLLGFDGTVPRAATSSVTLRIACHVCR